MKIRIISLSAGLLLLSSCLVSKKKYEALTSENTKLKQEVIDATKSTLDLENKEAKVGYSLGVNIANSLKSQGLESIDTAAVAKAMGDVFAGRKTELTPQESEAFLKEHFTKLQNQRIEKLSGEGAEFLAKNSMKEGVVTLPSGLQYKILKQGTGAKPGPTDKVKTHYHGTLVDGTVFDSSVERGQPISFPVNGVIKGWTEALQLMPVGSKWELYIPHYLAYGERGQGKIGPYSALIFTVELLDIEK